jgi:hypothetical protein
LWLAAAAERGGLLLLEVAGCSMDGDIRSNEVLLLLAEDIALVQQW